MSMGGTSGLTGHRRRFWTPVAEGAIPEQRRRATAKATGVRGLRKRRPKDVAACARLLRVIHYESHYPEQWPDAPRAWLADQDVLDAWVVERQDEILGHVAISRVGQESISAYRWREMTGHEPAELATVSRLFVRRRARHLGIGTALLDAAVTEIRARGLVPVLQVVDQHQDAVQLCRALGWRLLSMDQSGVRGERQRIHCYEAPAPKPLG